MVFSSWGLAESRLVWKSRKCTRPQTIHTESLDNKYANFWHNIHGHKRLEWSVCGSPPFIYTKEGNEKNYKKKKQEYKGSLNNSVDTSHVKMLYCNIPHVPISVLLRVSITYMYANQH